MFYIENKTVGIKENNTVVEDEEYKGTPGLWELIVSVEPKVFTDEDYKNYASIMLKTNTLHRDNNPNDNNLKSNNKNKWTKMVNYKKERWGKGIVVIPSDPNALLERLDFLIARQEAGHTGVGNELISICDELKRQGVLDTKSYKKINSIIKNDST